MGLIDPKEMDKADRFPEIQAPAPVPSVRFSEITASLEAKNKPVSVENCCCLLDMIDALARQLKEYKQGIMEEAILCFQDAKITSYNLGDDVWLLTDKTTDRFNSDEIKKAMQADDVETRNLAFACLPKNPSWNKKPVKALCEKLKIELAWEDVKQVIIKGEAKVEKKLSKVPKVILEANRGEK